MTGVVILFFLIKNHHFQKLDNKLSKSLPEPNFLNYKVIHNNELKFNLYVISFKV